MTLFWVGNQKETGTSPGPLGAYESRQNHGQCVRVCFFGWSMCVSLLVCFFFGGGTNPVWLNFEKDNHDF